MAKDSTIEQHDDGGFCLKYAGCYDGDRDIPVHAHAVTEVVYVCAGDCISRLESSQDESLHAHPGMCFVIPPHVQDDQRGRCRTVFINFGLRELLSVNRVLLLDLSDDPMLQGWFRDLSILCEQRDRALEQPLATAIWRRMRPRCQKASQTSDGRYSTRLEDALKFINNRYRDHITAHDIARYTCGSVTWLNREFNREFGCSVMRYVYNFRLEVGMHLLGNDYLLIDEIADRCGFAGANYFIRAFRRRYGRTPGQMRSAARGEFGNNR